MNSKKLLIVVNVDWFFLSHRLPVALAAKEAGYDVYVVAADTGSGTVIEEHGLTFIPFPFSRKGTRLFSELLILPRLFTLYRNLAPDLVHHVTIKPVLYGSWVALFQKNVRVVNAITGLGGLEFAFSNGDKQATFKKWLVHYSYRKVLRNPRSRTIFQNDENREKFIKEGWVDPSQARMIRGSGADCSVYYPDGEPESPPIILLAARMIWDKGIREFIDAALIIRKKRPDVRFVLAGLSDDGNENAVPEKQLREWTEQGVAEWWGHRDDMPEIFRRVTMVVLPTWYPEGVPKVLIEAAASGKPLITTDRPGCRDIVRDGVNGMLIPSHDTDSLIKAIEYLLDHPDIARRYGDTGREIVQTGFSEEIVKSQTLDLYKELL